MDKLLEKDLFVRILSVVLGVALWVQVYNTAQSIQAHETIREIKGVSVSWRNLPVNLAVDKVSPYSVSIRIRGDADTVGKLTKDDFDASVNLHGATAGQAAYNLDVAVPRGVTLLSTLPDQVTISLLPVVERSFKVNLHLVGSPAPGYRAGTVSVDPGQVVVRGPEPQLAAVASAEAGLDIGGATGNVEEDVPVRLLDAKGQVINSLVPLPATVHVVLPVENAWPSRSLAVRVPVVGVPANGYRLKAVVVSPDHVLATGPPDALGSMTKVDTAPVDLNGADKDFTAVVPVVVPEGISQLSPARVTVSVQLSAASLPGSGK